MLQRSDIVMKHDNLNSTKKLMSDVLGDIIIISPFLTKQQDTLELLMQRDMKQGSLIYVIMQEEINGK